MIITQQFHFHHQNQEPGDSVADYNAELCQLQAPCKFDRYLEDALQNRLVCGHQDESVKYWLLTEPKLTLAKTIELAQGMETAASDKQEMKWAVMAIKKVATPPRESALARGTPCMHHGKPGMIFQPVLSRMSSITIARRKATWPVYAGLRERPLRVTNTYVLGRGYRPQSGGMSWVDVSESEALPQDENPEPVE